MNKVYIKDQQDNKVLPYTHVSAVLDDEGNDLSSHLGAFEDEVRGLVETPHQEYVTVATYSALPASGSEDTIYRVSSWDGSANSGAGAVDVTVYSEYAWNGSDYVFLCVKSQIDEVFDITVYNSNTKYADLSAALGVNGVNIPESLRKGGMSVKYVQSSDNKYVQFRCMAHLFTTDVTQWAIVEEGVYVENPEYIYVKTDNDSRILWAIKKDGTIYYGAGVPQQVIDYINDKIAELSLDEYEDIVSFLGNLITGDKTLQQLLNEKVDKEEGKSLIDSEYASTKSTTDIPDFLDVILDTENKILAGRTPDGDAFEKVGFFTPKVSIGGHTIENIEDPEGRSEITTDSEGKIISYRDSDGVKYEEIGIKANNATINHLNLTNAGMTEFQQALKDAGFQPSGKTDLTDFIASGKEPLHLPKPRCAMINITNLEGTAVWPGSKTVDYPYLLEYWDVEGNYFKTPIIFNAQGNSSMGMPKKNGAADILYYKPLKEEDWSASEKYYVPSNTGHGYIQTAKGTPYSSDMCTQESAELKFGNWVVQDSFHLKAYYCDYFVGVCPIGYQLFDQIQATRDVFTDRDWKKALLPSKETIGLNCNAFKGEDDKYSLDNDARCYPDGFPCIAYLNGEFYGVYSWQLKKHRDNYQMSKKKPKHIHLDGAISKDAVFLANGVINWDLVSQREGVDGIEFRNPKPKKKKDGWDLLCIDGTKYDGDNNMNELMGEDTQKAKSIYVWSVPSEFSGCVITITIDGVDFVVNVPGDATRQSVAQQIAAVDFSSKGYTCRVVNSARVLFVDENENPQWFDLAVSVAGQTRVSVTAYNNYSIDYDANNESHVKSNQVKQIFTALSTRIAELREMENPTEQGATPATESEIRAKIAEYFDIQSFIDYLIFGDITANYDGFIKNWQWITYDGKKWFVEPYDLDGIFGWSGWGQIGTTGRYGNSKDIPTGWIIQYYQVELNARYKELRDKGILSTSNIIKLFKEWIAAIGTDNFQRNHDKWPIDREHYSAGPVEGHFDNIYRVSNWLDQRIANCDTYYSYEE